MKAKAMTFAAVFAAAATAGGAAYAAWLASSTGNAAGQAEALAMPTGATPTAPATSTGTVTLTWNAAQLAGSNLTSYRVTRYPAAGGSGSVIACASQTITASVVSCTYTETAAGSYQYTDTPLHANWVGGESAKSAVVVVAPVDSTAPTTTASPSAEANAAGWHKADVTVTLSASDAAPGVVKQITYSATGAQPIASTTVLGSSATVPAITTVGTTTLSYFAQDVAGNTEATKTLVIKLDKTAPTTTASPSPAANAAGWHRANVSVALSATDPAPGAVKQITYSATGAQAIASTTVAGSSATPVVTTEGTTTINFFSEDTAGNVEATKSLNVKLDKTAPGVSSVALVNKAGGQAGRPEQGDSIVVAFSEAPDLGTLCSGWMGSTIGTGTDNDVTVTVTDGGSSPDTVGLSVGSCSGGFNFGSISLAASGATGYVTSGNGSGFIRFRDQVNGTPSTVSWDAASKKLTITLGTLASGGGGTVGTVGASNQATYTPSSAIKDPAGNAIAGPATATAVHF
ncbi:MAG: hypothetical protein M3394_00505 [Actinomycetota bacterium]|nr:hypothetical protein [Actinomycetota bacterium]